MPINNAHERAPTHVRSMPVPRTFSRQGPVCAGDPPDGLLLARQADSGVWKWWHISTRGIFREAWCLEKPEGGALEIANIVAWKSP